MSIDRVEPGAGGLLTVLWTVHNRTNQPFALDALWPTSGPHVFTGGGVTAMTVTDRETSQRYYPVRDDQDHCLCYKGTHNNGNGHVAPHDARTVYDVYRPDPMPQSIDISVKGFGAARNVPVPGTSH